MTAKESKERNWLRFRLAGIQFNHNHTALMTAEESQLLQQLMAAKTKLIEGWDENSIKLGLNIKPYKCSWCGKRDNTPHEYEGSNYCTKHYKEFITDDISNRIPTPNSSMDNTMVRNVDGSTTIGNSNYSDNTW